MPKEIKIEDFSGGMNTLLDDKTIAANESPEIINMDITARGAVVTSPGYELVSSGSGLSGGTKDIITYEKTPTTTDHYMVITHDDDHYEVDPASFTWNSIGDYGTAATNTGGIVYKGTSTTRRVILGSDESANTIQKWDDTTYGNIGGTPPSHGWIMEEFQGRLFIANDTVLYYSDAEDETDWTTGGGTIQFNDYITGLSANDEFLVVFTRDEAFAVQFFYNDSFALSAPLKKPFKNSLGCVAHKTIKRVYNDVYYLSTDGVQRFGADAQFIGSNLRINTLSWKITPSIRSDKLNQANVERSCGIYFDRKYYCSVPYGGDTVNTRTFLYNYDFDAWVIRTGIIASNYAVLKSTTGLPELYFAHHTAPDLYKFNSDFTYNGVGYERSWQSKKFTGDDEMMSKFWHYLDLRGAKYIGSKFKVDMTVDGVTKTYEVDDDALEPNSSGGYYGDEYYGDMFYGGENAGQWKRYSVRLPFPKEITRGHEFQVKLYNSAAGQPWSLDYLVINFDDEADVKIPKTAQTANLIA